LDLAAEGVKRFVTGLAFTPNSQLGGTEGDPRCVDLLPYCPDQRRSPGLTNQLARAPAGRWKAGSTEFELHQAWATALASAGSEAYGWHYPQNVSGIKVGRKCQVLHFLHLPAGASYLVHFADGKRWEIPIQPYDNRSQQSMVAWKGLTADRSSSVEIYQTSWLNPFPNVSIESIDVTSDQEWATHALLAITVE
jgi:hypothetical protein